MQEGRPTGQLQQELSRQRVESHRSCNFLRSANRSGEYKNMQTPQIVFIIFTAVTSIGVLIQAFVLLGMFLAVKKTTSEVHKLSDQLKQHLVPAIATTR